MLFLNKNKCFLTCAAPIGALMFDISRKDISQPLTLRTMVSLRKLIRLLPLAPFGVHRSEERRAGEIRIAMLNMLRLHSGNAISRVAQRVQFAGDLEALWYLRQDVMTALSDLDGEGAARRQMKQINSMFKGRLPDAMGPRAHRRMT